MSSESALSGQSGTEMEEETHQQHHASSKPIEISGSMGYRLRAGSLLGAWCLITNLSYFFLSLFVTRTFCLCSQRQGHVFIDQNNLFLEAQSAVSIMCTLCVILEVLNALNLGARGPISYLQE